MQSGSSSVKVIIVSRRSQASNPDPLVSLQPFTANVPVYHIVLWRHLISGLLRCPSCVKIRESKLTFLEFSGVRLLLCFNLVHALAVVCIVNNLFEIQTHLPTT